MFITRNLAVPLALGLLSCGMVSCGGGSGDSGTVLQGSLIEAGGAEHRSVPSLRHGENQPIENVEICALGSCSITDDSGQWGFSAGELPANGTFLITVNGHGIATSTILELPADAHDVSMQLRHVAGGTIEAHDIVVDGTAVGADDTHEPDSDDHEHEEGTEDHSHE